MTEPASGAAPMVLLVDDNEMALARAKSVLSARCVVVGRPAMVTRRSKQPRH